MSKRRAGTELTHDNWDQEEEEEEEAGIFKAAEKDVIAKRAIKKAKRRVPGDGQNTTGPSSPFAAFAGFGGLTSTTTKKPEASFGGFSAETTKKPDINFSSSSAPDSTSFSGITSKKPEVSFGGFTSTAAAKKSEVSGNEPRVAVTPAENTAPVISAFVLKTSSSITPITSSSSTSLNGGASSTAKKNMNPEYSKQLRSLNQSVSAWIQQHVNANPLCDLTPVFEDYKKHLGVIEKKHANSSESVTTSGSNKSAASTSNLGSMATSTTSTSSAALGGFSFVKSTTPAPSQSTFSFKSTAPSSSGPPAATAGFSFSKSPVGSELPAVGAVGAVKPFSFGIAQASSSTKSEAAKSSGANGDEPPKVEFKQVEEKDALYSKRCKLFYKKDDVYKDRGVGMLYLKKTGEKGQMLLRADTNLGNVILNVSIHPKMPATRQGKNNVLIMTAMNPPIHEKCPKCNKKYPQQQESNRCESGCTPDVEPLLLRVKTGEDADQLLAEINTFKE